MSATSTGREATRGIERWATYLACAMVVALTLMTLLDVLGRNLLNTPFPGATELTEMLLVAMTFLFYPRVAWRNMHISVDLFDFFRGPALKRGLQVVMALMGAAVFATLAWRLWLLTERAQSYGDVTPSLNISMAWPIGFMALMSAVTALVYVLMLFVTPPEGSHTPITD